jgi:hypothetical protein
MAPMRFDLKTNALHIDECIFIEAFYGVKNLMKPNHNLCAILIDLNDTKTLNVYFTKEVKFQMLSPKFKLVLIGLGYWTCPRSRFNFGVLKLNLDSIVNSSFAKTET